MQKFIQDRQTDKTDKTRQDNLNQNLKKSALYFSNTRILQILCCMVKRNTKARNLFLARKRAASLCAAKHAKKRVTIFAEVCSTYSFLAVRKTFFVSELQRQPNKTN